MAITASFTADQTTLIPPSATVNFTDTSTGSPDSWIWSFGDGEFSYEQNPTHTYELDAGQTFTVSLKAYVSAADWTVTSLTSYAKQNKGSHSPGGPTEADELEAWDALGWTGSTPDTAAFTGRSTAVESFEYLSNRIVAIYSILPNISGISVGLYAEVNLKTSVTNYPATLGTQGSAILLKINGSTVKSISGLNNLNTDTIVYNAEALQGETNVNVTWTPNGNLIGVAEGGNTWKGIIAKVKMIQKRYTGNAGDLDEMILGNYISFYVSPEDTYIDFVGTPLNGTSALAVQFTDLSTAIHALSVWDFGDGNSLTYAGETHPLNTYTTDGCSIDLL